MARLYRDSELLDIHISDTAKINSPATLFATSVNYSIYSSVKLFSQASFLIFVFNAKSPALAKDEYDCLYGGIKRMVMHAKMLPQG